MTSTQRLLREPLLHFLLLGGMIFVLYLAVSEPAPPPTNIITIGPARIEQLSKEGKPFAGTAKWLAKRLDESLSACQLGITMASLALGFVGEPAVAALLEKGLGQMLSDDLTHALGIAIALSIVVFLHLAAALH